MAVIPRRSQVGQDTRRGRGPRLPGGQDVPTVDPARTRDPGLNADPSAFGADIGKATQQIGQGIMAAGQRIQNRADVARKARARRQFRETLAARARDFQTEADLTDPDAPVQFGSMASALQAQTLESVNISPDAKAQLQAELEAERAQFVDSVAAESVRAQQTIVEQEIGSEINALTLKVAEDPASFGEAAAAAIDIYDGASAAFSTGATEAGKRAAVSLLAETVVERQLARGDIEGAMDLLEDPGTQRLLTPDALSRDLRRIASARAGQVTDVKGIPRDVFNRLSPDQQARVLGAVPDRNSIKGVPEEIFSQMSGDEQRRLLGIESPAEAGQAAGMAALSEAETIAGRRLTGEERAELSRGRPYISITEEGEREITKQLGKMDAERVIEQEKRGQQAFRDLSEITRMRSALDSGRFTTGVFSDTRQFLARMADFVGAGEETQNLLGDAATADTLDAASARLAVDAAEKLGRVTNMSLQFIRDSLPNLTRTPDGNRILLEVMERASEREIELATMADRFIQDFGTLRPEGERTYFQAVRDLEESDPVITEELRQRITEGSENAPNTFRDILGEADEPPQGVEAPQGFKFMRMEGNRPVFRAEREVRSGGRVLPPGTTFLGAPVEEQQQQEGGELGPQGSLQPDESGKVPQDRLLASFTDSGLDPVVAAGFVGNLMQESTLDPKAVGDNKQSFGLFQHNRSRAKELFDFARERGEDVAELTLNSRNRIQQDLEELAESGKVPSAEAQIAFALQELQGSESETAQALQGVTDPGEAAQIIAERFFRPSDPQMQKRIAAAQAAARQTG